MADSDMEREETAAIPTHGNEGQPNQRAQGSPRAHSPHNRVTRDASENSNLGERALVQLRLDTIQLPEFSGDLTNWEAFRDMFEYLVDKSAKLTDVVKFHQLRTHLKGMAFDTIRGYQLSGTNYQAAWNDIKRRFDRKEEIIDAYIRKFIEVRAISHQVCPQSLRQIVDTTNQMMRALPNLGIVVTSWDPFVTFIVESKLDDKTRQEWKAVKGLNSTPNAKILLNWIENRAIELQASNADEFSRTLRRGLQRH